MITFRDNSEAKLAVIKTTKNINFMDELEDLIVSELNSVDFDLYQEGASINILDMQLSRGKLIGASGEEKFYSNTYNIFYEVKIEKEK